MGLVGGNLCSINDDDDPKAFEEAMQKLFKRIKKKIDTSFFTDVAVEHDIDPVAVLASKSGKKLVASPLVPAPVPPEQRRCEEEMFEWLLAHCGPRLEETSAERDATAEVYKALFRQADERTLARVGKRVGKVRARSLLSFEPRRPPTADRLPPTAYRLPPTADRRLPSRVQRSDPSRA